MLWGQIFILAKKQGFGDGKETNLKSRIKVCPRFAADISKDGSRRSK
jgi:hypothetical protein